MAFPCGVSAPAVLANQMTSMTYASGFTAINHRISDFSQSDRQMTDEGQIDGSRGDSRLNYLKISIFLQGRWTDGAVDRRIKRKGLCIITPSPFLTDLHFMIMGENSV